MGLTKKLPYVLSMHTTRRVEERKASSAFARADLFFLGPSVSRDISLPSGVGDIIICRRLGRVGPNNGQTAELLYLVLYELAVQIRLVLQ